MAEESAEFHCWYSADIGQARQKGQYILGKFGKYLNGPIVDLGCGEGALLLVLKEGGKKDLVGVESNRELANLAESWGVPVVRKDLLEYLREGELRPATYLYIDVVEHVPFEANLEVLERLPAGSRVIVQTPHTETLLGHQYYFKVPSHVAPYSPYVLKQMLQRAGYSMVAEGSVDGAHPENWRRKVRGFLARKLLGLSAEMVLGGGNYFVVADRLSAGTVRANEAGTNDEIVARSRTAVTRVETKKRSNCEEMEREILDDQSLRLRSVLQCRGIPAALSGRPPESNTSAG